MAKVKEKRTRKFIMRLTETEYQNFVRTFPKFGRAKIIRDYINNSIKLFGNSERKE